MDVLLVIAAEKRFFVVQGPSIDIYLLFWQLL
jgi:hypothetical protein